jgi:hypothetical protein
VVLRPRCETRVCLVYILAVELRGHRGAVFPPPAGAAELARICRPAAANMHGWRLVVGGGEKREADWLV